MTWETRGAAGTAEQRGGAARLGFWAGLLTSALTVVSFGLAIIAVPPVGPFCPGDCVEYPFVDPIITAKAPHDFYWMYPAIVLMLTFVVLVACLHRSAAARAQDFSIVALAFATLSAGVIAADYYIQIATIQPSIVRGETEGVALLSQYNPHGVFIALEELGYVLMSLAFLFAAPAFGGRRWFERVLRWLFVLAALLTLGGWGVYYAIYGYSMEYRFEVFAISVNWLTLAVAGVLLSLWFRAARGAVVEARG